MRWHQPGSPIRVVTKESERDRFMRHCNWERVRCGLTPVEKTGIVVERPGTGGWMPARPDLPVEGSSHALFLIIRPMPS